MKQKKQKFYFSPEVELIETQVQAVICQSGSVNDMIKDSKQTLDW